jgi:hypothetical protein
MTTQKRYIVVLDTMGDGLQVFPKIELDVYDGEEQLKEAVLYAADYILSDEEHELEEYKDYERCGLKIAEQIVILELDDDFTTEKRNKFIYETIESQISETRDNDYEQYLKLKEKFEGGE